MDSILLVEDDTLILNGLKKSLLEINPDYTIHTAATYSEANDLIKTNSYSIFFLDIKLSDNVDEPTGIDLGYEIRKNKENYNTPIIYVTSVDFKINEALNNLHCYAYLKKPFSVSNIKNALNLINKTEIIAPYVSYKDINGVFVQIKIEEIVRAYSNNHVTTIFCTDCYFEISRLNLGRLQKDLGDSFIRCNKATIVNTKYINNVDLYSLSIIVNGESLHISRTYKKDFKGWSNNVATNT